MDMDSHVNPAGSAKEGSSKFFLDLGVNQDEAMETTKPSAPFKTSKSINMGDKNSIFGNFE